MKKSLVLLLFATALSASAQSDNSVTRLVMLGTGTPNADPDRFGPSLAIVVNNVPYLVDCGPGVVRRAAAASQKGVAGLEAPMLRTLFITHLHSDHTVGLPDFLLTPAVLERKGNARVYGPAGIKKMTAHILAAYREDIDTRISGLEKGDPEAYEVEVHEVRSGIVYKDSNVTVTAFRVEHGSWKEAYGYKFKTPDKTIVVSGDCTFSEELIRNAVGCDILVHEVYSEEGFSKRPPKWQAYHSKFHTSSGQLAEIAGRVKPKLLVLTHQLIWSSTEEKLVEEISSRYDGKVVSAGDLDVF